MEKVIALDIGNVCIKLEHAKAIAALSGGIGKAAPSPALLYSIDRLERGLIRDSQWLDVMRAETGNKFTNDEILRAWNMIIGSTMDGMHELLKEISKLGYRFVYFSDTSKIHILEVYRKLSFAHLVSGGVFSYEAHAKKPETAMYEAFEKAYGKPCFYIDDKAENIEGALKRGWTAHLFTNADSFRKAFFEKLS